MGEPLGLLSMGLHRVRHDLIYLAAAAADKDICLSCLQILHSLNELISEFGTTRDNRMLSHAIAGPYKNGGYNGNF